MTLDLGARAVGDLLQEAGRHLPEGDLKERCILTGNALHYLASVQEIQEEDDDASQSGSTIGRA